MANYLFCASNESIPGILCISYFHRCNGPLKDALRLLNMRCLLDYRSRRYTRLPTPYNFVFIKKLRECRGCIESEGMVEEQISYSYINSKLNIVGNDKINLVDYGRNFYKNSIEEVKLVFDHIEGDYVNYLIEDHQECMKSIKESINNRIMKETEDRIINSYFKTLEDTLEDTLDIMKETEDKIINNEKIMKETEDRIINSYFKTLEDTLEKKKAELERLDAIIIDRNTEIAELTKIIKYIKK